MTVLISITVGLLYVGEDYNEARNGRQPQHFLLTFLWFLSKIPYVYPTCSCGSIVHSARLHPE